jgi:hypothetical protein
VFGWMDGWMDGCIGRLCRGQAYIALNSYHARRVHTSRTASALGVVPVGKVGLTPRGARCAGSHFASGAIGCTVAMPRRAAKPACTTGNAAAAPAGAGLAVSHEEPAEDTAAARHMANVRTPN